ncbi:diacylglycerol/lipid kinase family protein [Microbacterium oleivorans]|uniref:NAD(+)/NADH kinase n=1 Tax=Microbacterium oleivorans TaxID=273677 RepID=A0A7D5J0R5_9MICO|nr:diacylglycerol kinase family protein [Microbacterium oleivorans]QLD12975.1 NAD(+)/NADH kinase [Microbacterium oleivorans]
MNGAAHPATGTDTVAPPSHAAVVYHPAKAPLARLRQAIGRHEAAAGWASTRWYETAADDSGAAAARRALAEGADVVIVSGGDGTVRAAVEVLQGTDTPVALVPAGTGNLLARDLGISLADVDGCVEAAFTGVGRRIDVGFAELEDETGTRRRHAFVVMAGIGLDADMADKTSPLAKKHLGWFAYVSPIARSILANRLFSLHYRVDGGRTRSARAHTVIVGNCGTLAGNMLLIPRAVVDDGLLDVVMMRPRSRFGWAGIGSRLTLQGMARRSRLTRRVLEKAPELHALAYAQGQRFEARFDLPRLIQLDGDGFGHIVAVRIEVAPSALALRVRASAGS